MLLSFPTSSPDKKRVYPMIRKIFIETERGLVAQVTFRRTVVIARNAKNTTSPAARKSKAYMTP